MRIADVEELLAAYKREGIDPRNITGLPISVSMGLANMAGMAWGWSASWLGLLIGIYFGHNN